MKLSEWFARVTVLLVICCLKNRIDPIRESAGTHHALSL